MSDEVAEILDACADDVSQDGHWIQGAMRDSLNGACALGIIFRNVQGIPLVAEFANERVHLHSAVIDSFREGASLPTSNIGKWNDHPERTQGEVADAFRTAAKIAREKAEKNV